MIKGKLLAVATGMCLVGSTLVAMEPTTISKNEKIWLDIFNEAKADKAAQQTQKIENAQLEKPDMELYPKNIFEFFRAVHEGELIETTISGKGFLTSVQYLVNKKLPQLIKRDVDWKRYAQDKQGKQKLKRYGKTNEFIDRLGKVIVNPEATAWLKKKIEELRGNASAGKKEAAQASESITTFLTRLFGSANVDEANAWLQEMNSEERQLATEKAEAARQVESNSTVLLTEFNAWLQMKIKQGKLVMNKAEAAQAMESKVFLSKFLDTPGSFEDKKAALLTELQSHK
jgi:hypothetical protein